VESRVCGCGVTYDALGWLDKRKSAAATYGGFFLFKQKTAYEIVDCDWSSDVCSSDLANGLWLIPAVILTGGAAFMRTHSPKGEVRLIAVTVASLMVFVHFAAAPAFTLAYDLEPSAKAVKAFQDAERPVAYVGKYHGEFHFLGRLERPITVLPTMADGKAWAAANPTGVVIATLRESSIPTDSTPLSVRPYRGKVLAMWDASRF